MRTESIPQGLEVERQREHLGAPPLDWLDALKGVAIAAVVLDHAFIVDNYLLWKHLYFAVSWFIFLAGVSNTHSARRRGYEPARDTLGLWKRRLLSLLPPYLFVSFLAYMLFHSGSASVGNLASNLVLFDSLPPLYFIALLLQLLAVFPLLYWALYRGGWRSRCLVAVAIVPVAAVLSHTITFPWVLGAHYLFGASFLYLFVLGTIAEPFLSSQSTHPFVWLALGVALFLPAERLNVSTNGALMTHPPSNVLLVYSVGLLAIGYAASRLLARTLTVRLAGVLGRHSMDIFLYHFFFLIPIFRFRHAMWIRGVPFVWGQVILMLIAVPVAIGGSLLAAHLAAGTGSGARKMLRRLRPELWPLRPRVSVGVDAKRSDPLPPFEAAGFERYAPRSPISLFDAERPMRRHPRQ